MLRKWIISLAYAYVRNDSAYANEMIHFVIPLAYVQDMVYAKEMIHFISLAYAHEMIYFLSRRAQNDSFR